MFPLIRGNLPLIFPEKGYILDLTVKSPLISFKSYTI
jgi:hypothetical protein